MLGHQAKAWSRRLVWPRGRLALVLLSAAGLMLSAAVASGQTQVSTATLKGDAERGKTLYVNIYRCSACHGSRGETTAPGAPRLVPLPRAQDAFITYLRNPKTPAMPAFADVPEQSLADIYAYIRSIKSESPPVESIPLLRDLLQRMTKRN